MIDAFDAHQELRGFSPATRKRRRWTLTNIVAECRKPLDQLTVVDIEVFLARRATASTRRALLGDLRSFYRFAVRRGLVDHDPTSDLDTPKVPSRMPTPLSLDDLDLARRTAAGKLRTMIVLGGYAGLRVSEIGRLTVADLVDGSYLVVRQGKGAKDRAVPMHPVVVEHFERMRYRSEIVAMTAGGVSNAIRKHFRSLGIDRRPHDLRHTFITEAARRAPLHVVAKWAGHRNVSTTQGYALVDESDGVLVRAMFRHPSSGGHQRKGPPGAPRSPLLAPEVAAA